MKKILIITDAWEPQVNGVVTTMTTVVQKLREKNFEVDVIHPGMFHTFPLPNYPEISVAWNFWDLKKKIEKSNADYMHISVEGPLGVTGRHYCLEHEIPYTTCIHTKFPEYVYERFGIGLDVTKGLLKWFHNSAAKTLYMSGGQMGAPMVFRGPNGAAARVGAQHSQDYTSWYAHIPGLKVAAPYSASDAKGLLKSAIRDDNPVIFLENEILYGRSFDVPDIEDYIVPFGKARIWRKGTDITIVSFGIGMQYALKAAEELAAQGIEAEVLDLRTIRPIDYATIIQSFSKTNRCVTVEEGFQVASMILKLCLSTVAFLSAIGVGRIIEGVTDVTYFGMLEFMVRR